MKVSERHVDVRDGMDTIRVASSLADVFDTAWMDESELQQRGLLSGHASAGRGNTWFFEHEGMPMVLRHYRRGGLMRKISERYYLWTGLESSRAMAEFAVLQSLEELELPVSNAVAARVERDGWRYRASLITHRIDGQTLAERLVQTPSSIDWRAIGKTIADFHAVGLWHADLNAHNILIDDNAGVTLLDFDRARLRKPPRSAAEGWSVSNLERLHRSLRKVCAAGGISLPGTAWMELRDAWRNVLMERHLRSR